MSELGLLTSGCYLGRAAVPDVGHPLVVTARDAALWDITAPGAATVRDICELDDPQAYVRTAAGRRLGTCDDIACNSLRDDPDRSLPTLLSPLDLQAIKAAGVTFAGSLLERVIEERSGGNAVRASAIRRTILHSLGEDLSAVKPGSAAAQQVRRALLEQGLWSPYLEVGIGPDAEIFTKCQPMASVGFGTPVGLHPISNWNNPEPEIVLVVNSRGEIVGATLGNDVNLRDVEGRSALLLGKAKDNNASAAIGPLIRLFDDRFSLADVERTTVSLVVDAPDGFTLRGSSSMSKISRAPADLVAAVIGPHHQYPDGFALYLGTMFVPSKDRGVTGAGFTHRIGDVVTIACPTIGKLVNRVLLSPDCAPWTYGASHLLKDLAQAGLLLRDEATQQDFSVRRAS